MMRSGNPALNKNTFKSLTNTSGRVMTLDGAVNKTAISLTILLAAAYYTYTLPIESASNFVWPGLIRFYFSTGNNIQEGMVSYNSSYLCHT